MRFISKIFLFKLYVLKKKRENACGVPEAISFRITHYSNVTKFKTLNFLYAVCNESDQDAFLESYCDLPFVKFYDLTRGGNSVKRAFKKSRA